MEAFQCHGCSQPLKPPVFQCFCGNPHFICSPCNGKLPQRKFSMCTCSKSLFKHCPSMDKLLSEIVLPKRGCAGSLAYDRCPGSGCGFSGQRAEILDHFATHHKWSMTGFTYGEEFKVPTNPGLHILRGEDDQIFMLNVDPRPWPHVKPRPWPPGHGVSFLCILPKPPECEFQCLIYFSCISADGSAEHDPLGRLLYLVEDSSMSDVSSKGFSCFLPNRQGVTAVLIKLKITKRV